MNYCVLMLSPVSEKTGGEKVRVRNWNLNNFRVAVRDAATADG